MPDEVVSEIAASLEQGIRLVQRNTIPLVPVREGILRDILSEAKAIGKKDKGLRWEFGFRLKRHKRDGFYAPWVEHGTKGSPENNVPPMRAQPFMQPGFKMSVPQIRSLRDKAMDSALNKVARFG